MTLAARLDPGQGPKMLWTDYLSFDNLNNFISERMTSVILSYINP